jgi:hypothetical protein
MYIIFVILCLFNDAISRSDNIASNVRRVVNIDFERI